MRACTSRTADYYVSERSSGILDAERDNDVGALLNVVRVNHGPMISLLTTHGKPDCNMNFLNAEKLKDRILCSTRREVKKRYGGDSEWYIHIVLIRNTWEIRAVVRCWLQKCE